MKEKRAQRKLQNNNNDIDANNGDSE